MGSLSDAVTLKRRLFDVDEYHRLGEAGILGEDDRVELIEGQLVEWRQLPENTQRSFPRF